MYGWVERLDWETETWLHVEYELDGREVRDYSVALSAGREGGRYTVRVYDGAHGINELHRHTRTEGKHPGEVFHRGTLGEGMRAAIFEIRSRHREMIAGWDR